MLATIRAAAPTCHLLASSNQLALYSLICSSCQEASRWLEVYNSMRANSSPCFQKRHDEQLKMCSDCIMEVGLQNNRRLACCFGNLLSDILGGMACLLKEIKGCTEPFALAATCLSEPHFL